MNTLNFLTGRTTDQLTPFKDSKYLVHREMLSSLEKLFKKAANEGFELALTSSYRSFDDQVKIWNNKAAGVRPVLDSDSNPVDLTRKTKEEIMFLILRWSALPGASRHHWGSDFDLYDKSALTGELSDYKVQLIPSEYEEQGPFYQSTLWLNENMADFGFFRPYSKDGGGIAPEPWHLSFAPLSEKFLDQLSFDLFEEHLRQSEFLLLEEALKNSSDIYQRFIQLPK